ncbi:MAG: hypothetical protein LHV69_00775 [Elusimicrobia bacterium]|nr:hypothetical protein [Candidatus Obscuribacterium magneticum]
MDLRVAGKALKVASWLITLGLLTYIAVDSSRWFPGKQSFIERQEPLRGGDDTGYYYTAEYFWGLEHDANLVRMNEQYGRVLETYPVREIGLGSLVLPFQRTLGRNWRIVYANFVIFLNVLGIFVLAFGLASFIGPPYIFTPLFVYWINKFSLYITHDTAYCTEAVSRAIIPLFIGIAFLLSNVRLRRVFYLALSVVFVLAGLFLSLMKAQWIMGLFFMGLILLITKGTRKTGYISLIAFLMSFLALRGIHYYSFNHNKELFASNGLYALTFSLEGDEIMRIGCEEHRFPKSVEETVCNASATTLWIPLLQSQAPVEDKGRFLEVCSAINVELARKNMFSRIVRVIKNSGSILKEIYYVLQTPTSRKMIKLIVFWLLFASSLFILRDGKSVQALSVFAFLFGAVFLPSMTYLHWEYRFSVPVRSFFFTVPLATILAAIYLNKKTIMALVLKWPFFKKLKIAV